MDAIYHIAHSSSASPSALSQALLLLYNLTVGTPPKEEETAVAEVTTIRVEDPGIGSIAPSTPCCRIPPCSPLNVISPYTST